MNLLLNEAQLFAPYTPRVIPASSVGPLNLVVPKVSMADTPISMAAPMVPHTFSPPIVHPSYVTSKVNYTLQFCLQNLVENNVNSNIKTFLSYRLLV